MDDAAGDIAAHHDSVLEGLDGQPGLHPRVDRVPDDPAGERVLDSAAVELSFTRFVFRDVDEPELVRAVGSEHVPGPAVLVDDCAEVVVDRWSGTAALAALRLPERAEPAVG